MNRKKVPVFFSCDDNYIPFLGVAIKSLIENSTQENDYFIYVLHSNLDIENMKIITNMEKENVSICFIDVSEKLIRFGERLNLRDYYTVAIYFRIFIPNMFPLLDKAIYLDSDMVILDDIAKLYSIDLGDMLLGGVSDSIIAYRHEFRDYAELGCGIYPYTKYFNSGMMLMNLKGMRDFDLEGKFEYLFNKYHFDTVCPDQDYLNVICKDKVLYVDGGWDKMAIDDNYDGKPMIVHYNNFAKPWQQDGICYSDYFWQYADMTPYSQEIHKMRKEFTKEKLNAQTKCGETLVASTIRIVNDPNNFKNVFDRGVIYGK